jgi:hypothetical protein
MFDDLVGNPRKHLRQISRARLDAGTRFELQSIEADAFSGEISLFRRRNILAEPGYDEEKLRISLSTSSLLEQ